MKLEIVQFRTKDGKNQTVVLSKNQAIRLMLAKFEGEVSGIKIREVSC